MRRRRGCGTKAQATQATTARQQGKGVLRRCGVVYNAEPGDTPVVERWISKPAAEGEINECVDTLKRWKEIKEVCRQRDQRSREQVCRMGREKMLQRWGKEWKEANGQGRKTTEQGEMVQA